MSDSALAAFIQDKEAARAILIDVREKDEYDLFHVDGAILWPLSQIEKLHPEARAEFLKPYHDKQVYLHCRSGGRVLYALESLKNLHPHLIRLAQSPQQIQAFLY